ncbi:MAG: hypothetical protein AB1635_14850 [Acidobacteriota bacterium]
MRRVPAVLAAAVIVVQTIGPAWAAAEPADVHRQMACCHNDGNCAPSAPVLSCCGDAPDTPATPPPPTSSASLTPAPRLDAAPTLLPADAAPIAARVASAAFVARQGLLRHAPPHLRLHVFLI